MRMRVRKRMRMRENKMRGGMVCNPMKEIGMVCHRDDDHCNEKVWVKNG